MAVFEVLDNWTGKPVARPQRDDLPEEEHSYYAQFAFWVIDDDGALYIVNGKTGVVCEPPMGKYTVRPLRQE